jgi:hypothetical protein
MTKSFDLFIENLLTELVPASLEDTMGSTAEKVVKKVSELPGKSQHWQYLQNLDSEIREKIVKEIIKNVFSDNEDNTYSSTIDNVSDLKDSIKAAIETVAKENPEFKATSKTVVGFLADRLANKELLGNVKFTTQDGEESTLNKKVTQKEVRAALNKALSGETEEDLSEIGVERKGKSELPARAAGEFKLQKDYYLKTYDEIPSGTLQGDLSVAYDRLSGFSGEVHSGNKFAETLKKSDMGAHYLKQLFAANILEKADEDEIDSSDTEGFSEPEEDYIERITRGARKDLESSMIGNDRSDIFG